MYITFACGLQQIHFLHSHFLQLKNKIIHNVPKKYGKFDYIGQKRERERERDVKMLKERGSKKSTAASFLGN